VSFGRRAAVVRVEVSNGDQLASVAQGTLLVSEPPKKPEVPERFSVAMAHQAIPKAIPAEIDNFIRTFDRVTTRSAWHENGPVSVPEIARPKRDEVCFFSAWDFQIPTEEPAAWQLIECSDNGSGFLFAALINRVCHEIFGLHRDSAIEPPPELQPWRTAWPAWWKERGGISWVNFLGMCA